jgi:hypothetical protein
MTWGFYGRQAELRQLGEIFARGRWFFVKVTGRRRIGKTALIQQALPATGRKVFYIQIPDSGPAGVLSAVADALETFQVDPATVPRPTSLRGLAHTIGQLARAGYVVALDEFQYFNRERLREFCSHLQEEVDQLSATADAVPGGLLVLGSIQTEINALLEDRAAPLYNRTTDVINDDYFCRSATTISAGRRARPEGSSDPWFQLGADGHRRAGQVAEAEAYGRQEA